MSLEDHVLGPKGNGTTAHRVVCGRQEQRRTNAVQERAVDFDVRRLNTRESGDGNAVERIEHLRVLESEVHAL